MRYVDRNGIIRDSDTHRFLGYIDNRGRAIIYTVWHTWRSAFARQGKRTT